jgi:hypothetical protein
VAPGLLGLLLLEEGVFHNEIFIPIFQRMVKKEGGICVIN